MAKFSFTMPDSLQQQLSKLGTDIDRIAPKMIDEATPILQEAIAQKLSAHNRTGDLAKSTKAYKAKKVKNGEYYGRIGFGGYGQHNYKGKTSSVPNEVKALGIEYGNSHQTPQPFLQAAVNDAEPAVLEKMQETFTREAKLE